MPESLGPWPRRREQEGPEIMSALDRDNMTPRQAWLLAIRPRTLPVAVGPVVVGTAVAASQGGASLLPALAALAGALLLQIGSNIANDLFDYERGADTEERIGPPRAAQLGLLSPAEMRRGMLAVFGAAVGVGLYLAALGGWPIVVVGLLAIAAAIAYTGGPWPFGYKGLGDPAVFFFFGLVAVVGTSYVQTLQITSEAFAASLPVGALATAILVVNNVRDIETDRKAGKRTLAVRLGRQGARLEYVGLVASAYLVLPAFWLACGRSPWVMLALLSLPKACKLLDTVYHRSDGPSLNEALAGTAQLSLVYSLLLAFGWWL
jgi:1,4-dihydroxy-2-naphthoate octaprenyltransferase